MLTAAFQPGYGTKNFSNKLNLKRTNILQCPSNYVLSSSIKFAHTARRPNSEARLHFMRMV